MYERQGTQDSETVRSGWGGTNRRLWVATSQRSSIEGHPAWIDLVTEDVADAATMRYLLLTPSRCWANGWPRICGLSVANPSYASPIPWDCRTARWYRSGPKL